MLTFKRAIVLAAVCLTLLLIFRSSRQPPHIHNADQLPKPKSVENWIQGGQTKVPSQEAVKNEKPSPSQHSSWYGSESASHSKPKAQIPLQDLRSKPLRQQLEYTFPYDPLSKFPAYIWQTWKTTPSSGDFKEEFREPEASWTVLHPTFIHEVITDAVVPHLLKHLFASIPEVLEAYHALPLPVLKADFFRYLILNTPLMAAKWTKAMKVWPKPPQKAKKNLKLKSRNSSPSKKPKIRKKKALKNSL